MVRRCRSYNNVGHGEVFAGEGRKDGSPMETSVIALEDSGAIGPSIYRIRIVRPNRQRPHIGLCQSLVAGLPRQPSVQALEDAAVRSRKENALISGVHSQDPHLDVFQPLIAAFPFLSPIRALENPSAVSAGIEHCGIAWIQKQLPDKSIGGLLADGTPS